MAVFGVEKVLLKPQAQVQSCSSVRDGRGREVIREIPNGEKQNGEARNEE
jgi:hypothetical protein